MRDLPVVRAELSVSWLEDGATGTTRSPAPRWADVADARTDDARTDDALARKGRCALLLSHDN